MEVKYKSSSQINNAINNEASVARNVDTEPQRPEDPFLFYSNDENLRRALNFEPLNYTNVGTNPSVPIVRKTRISFETDVLSLLAEEIFGTELNLNGEIVNDSSVLQ